MSLNFFDPKIAESVGVNAAIIYQNLSYWCEKNAANGKHIHEGRAWTYNSNTAFAKLFPYFTENQIRTAVDKLIEADLILTGNFNETAYDRTKWYAVKTQDHLGNFANGNGTKPGPIPDKNTDKNQMKSLVALDSPPADLFSQSDVTTDQGLDPARGFALLVPQSDPVSAAFDLYNEAADRAGWSKCQARSKPRVAAMKARLKDLGGLDGWKVAIAKGEASDFLCNRTPRAPFSASLDFFLQASSLIKLMEGKYDNRGNGRASGAHATFDAFSAAVARM